MAEFFAKALTKIGDYSGQCVISVNGESLTIKSSQDADTIAKWQHNRIRKFRADINENMFIFESGSHGPFGVAEYRFELVKEDLFELQSAVTGFTGAHFSTKSPRHASSSSFSNSFDDFAARKQEAELANAVRVSPTIKAMEYSPAPSPSNPEVSLDQVKAFARVDNGFVDGEVDEKVKRSREHIYKELVKTEHDYVSDLKVVIDAYYDAMDPDNMSIPLRLRGKRDIVFGNLLDIYNFHDRVFSKALEFFTDCPERVGGCFMQFVSEFEMYSLYCKNRPKSEILVNETTESQAFFKGIQRNLAHALDLNSYLLKPVQRITKYQLLLKDLVKHSSKAKNAIGELEAAHSTMRKILQDLNDSMHTAGLTGLPDDIPEQGKLLAHDAFHVSTLEQGPLTLARNKEKHVFLFEKVVIISKKTETLEGKKGKKTDAYIYKEHLDLASVSLREMDDDHPLAFALSLYKSRQHKEYKFEAQTQEIQKMWVSEIRRLLQLQFVTLKMKKVKDTPPMSKKDIPSQNRRTLSASGEVQGSNMVIQNLALDLPARRRSQVVTEKPLPVKQTVDVQDETKTSKRNSWQLGDADTSPPPLPPHHPRLHEKTLVHKSNSNDDVVSSHQPVAVERKRKPSVPRTKPELPQDVIKHSGLDKNKSSSQPGGLNRMPYTNGAATKKGGLNIDQTVLDAIEDVRSNSNKIEWCACGYCDNNHREALVVYGSGRDSIDGLKKHMKEDNIVVGFVRMVEVIDGMPRTRHVYILWIGERSKPMAKAKITTQRGALEDLFKPFHTAIFATTTSDISERMIMDKVRNISGSKNRVM